MPPSKVTFIDDLPELDDIFDKQQSMNGYPPRLNPDFSKQMTDELSERDRTMRPLQGKIRQSSDFRMAIAGGSHGMQGMQGMPSGMHDMGMHGMQGMHGSHGAHGPRMGMNRHDDYLLIEPSDEEYHMGPRIQNIQNTHREREISCIEIAKHIKNCPICSKFYDTDKSLYIIIIIILLIFCILLLKKILIKD
jgi:hypothetical protein